MVVLLNFPDVTGGPVSGRQVHAHRTVGAGRARADCRLSTCRPDAPGLDDDVDGVLLLRWQDPTLYGYYAAEPVWRRPGANGR